MFTADWPLDTPLARLNLNPSRPQLPRRHLLRFCCALVPLVLLQAACTIEETPQEYIDHLTTPAGELEASRDELTVRLLSTAPALERRDRSSLSGALSATPEVYVIGVREGEALQTPRELVDTLLSMTRGMEVDVSDALVTVAPGNEVAWFRLVYSLVGGAGTEPHSVHFTGVFVRSEGNWRLTQGHLSRELSWPPENPDSVGTAAGDG